MDTPRIDFLPLNPHPFLYEGPTDCCALSVILFVVVMVEVKAYPLQAGTLEFEDLGGKNV